MDTHYRSPEDKNKIIYGEWVIYNHPYKGSVLATVQYIYAKKHRIEGNAPYYPDTSYIIDEDGSINFAESFRVKLLYTNIRTGIGMVTNTNCNCIRPMTEQENKDLAIYLSGDLNKLPTIMNSGILKEAVKLRLKGGTPPKPNSTFL